MKSPERTTRHMNALMRTKWDEFKERISEPTPQLIEFARTIYQIAFTDGFHAGDAHLLEEVNRAELRLVEGGR